MKIIFLEAVQNFGGSKRSMIEFSKQLINMGHEVVIVDFWGINSEFNSAVKSAGIPFRILHPNGNPIIISQGNNINKAKNIVNYTYKRALYKANFHKIVKSFRPDYVCVNSFKTLDILSSSAPYKIDYFVRGWTIGNSLKAQFFLRKYKVRFIAISEATRQAIHLQNNVPLDQIRVVKVQVKKQTDGIVHGSNFGYNNPISLLHAGTFIHNKGHHISLIIANELKKKDIRFKLTIAGLISPNDHSTKYYQKLLRMRDEFGLNNEVTFIVNNHNLDKEMQSANVLLNPSFTEGLSRVCLEAMSHGVPVISNPAGGVTDFVISNHTGFLVNFNCIDEYIDSIITYYNSPEIYIQHSNNARNLINQAYLDINIKNSLEQIYPTSGKTNKTLC